MIFRLYSLCMLALAGALLAPATLFYPIATSLDPSWRIALNLAVENDLVFGRDVVFPYGPLGFLGSRLAIAMGTTGYVLWDASVLIAFGCVGLVAFRRLTSYGEYVGLVLSALLLSWIPSRFAFDFGLEFKLFLLFMFALLCALERRSLAALASVSVAALVLFFFKVNVGFTALGTMVALLSMDLIRPSDRGRGFTLAWAVVFSAALYVASRWLHVDLVRYVGTGFDLGRTYVDAMYSTGWLEGAGVAYLVAAGAVLVSFGGVLAWCAARGGREVRTSFAYLFTAGALVLLYKSSFVRADSHHVYLFFTYASATIGLLCLLFPSPGGRPLRAVFWLSIVLSVAAVDPSKMLMETPARLAAGATYLAEVTGRKPVRLESRFLERNRLPQNVREWIGTRSVDVLPFEISYVYVNELPYEPRPLLQSYVTFSGTLDDLNYAKYVSNTAPGALLLSNVTIDQRHPFFTESKTKLAILTHYEVVGRYADLVVLTRRAQPIASKEVVDTPRRARLGETIALSEGEDLQFLSAEVEYSLLGIAARALLQPPRLWVTVRLEDGTERTYRAIKPMVTGGVLVNRLVESTDEAEAFFRHAGKRSRRVTGIKLVAGQAWGFRQEFDYVIRRVSVGRSS